MVGFHVVGFNLWNISQIKGHCFKLEKDWFIAEENFNSILKYRGLKFHRTEDC